MTWSRGSALILAGISVVALVAFLSSCTMVAQPPAKPTRAEMIERGRYLVMTSACHDCHTPGTLFGAPDFKRQLSGSELGWMGPWGVTYARNLTPDEETGLGTWTEAEIVTAFRAGSAPGGREILPPMPWPMYANFTDEDAFAIAAYLKSIPPVSHRVPDKLAPGKQPAGSFVAWPEPSEWDAPRADEEPEGN